MSRARRAMGWMLTAMLVACQRPAPIAGSQRLVSLSPSITETLFALGAGDRVVGVTDYCDFPADVQTRARAGTMLQPNYELIARLSPTLILGEATQSSPADRLRAIAPTTVLPWLTLPEIATSIRELGKIVDRVPAATELANRIETRLQATVPPDAPRVLLVIPGAPGPMSEVWYVKRGSLHDRVLTAAGGRNAIGEERTGPPVLSLEKLVAVDPDVVLLLVPTANLDDDTRRRYLEPWQALPLKAVKRNAVRVLSGSEVQSTGPRILDLKDRLAATLRELGGRP